MQNPAHWDALPATSAEGTMEQQVLDGFLRGIGTHLARVPRIQCEFPPPQHISSIQSISKDQPAKEFHLRCTFGLPQPSECSMGCDIMETKVIELPRGVLFPPWICPVISPFR
jgi:hypothetical protein